jgi:hypothetical protein
VRLVKYVTFRTLLIVMTTWKLKAKVADVKNAFLHGALKAIILLEVPKVMKAENNECLVISSKMNWHA